jgi:hypothetical protein
MTIILCHSTHTLLLPPPPVFFFFISYPFISALYFLYFCMTWLIPKDPWRNLRCGDGWLSEGDGWLSKGDGWLC